ncbi:ADP-ribose pyrophosphatase YjhB (NUDIX family) [Paenibacillus sp. JGP012]|uniref:NUDIX hydrolase n=1 Tax=Paenibacillus sp. JGP012 TaxID=2735914 RepID=UPI0016098D69|nr:NUDIX domain-containing protein [Paenibacillus sp. JGP012]MBB6023493.1 ADP-ribose pyrophosphatase YjhB (NUDIX family) [Paenibacillus sp. JGP012]
MSRGDRENGAASDTGAEAELHAEQLDRSKPVLGSVQQELSAVSEEEFLRTYDAGDYERPSVTVDMLVFTIRSEEQENYRKLAEPELGLLLIRRGGHPYLGQWALPGGFVSMQESLEDAARRELQTETGLDDIYLEQLYTWGDVGRDPRTRVISCSYMALVDSSELELEAGDDASEASWFRVEQRLIEEKRHIHEHGLVTERRLQLMLSNETEQLSAIVETKEQVQGRVRSSSLSLLQAHGIAFDHAKIIHYALERLRAKIEYTDIAFNLMPEKFTLTALQKVYEIISGKKLLAAAFRRKMADWVIETGEYASSAGHRPSRLYRLNPEREVI